MSGTGDAVGGDAAFKKRALDTDTAGGNARSGSSSNTSSGSIFNEAEDDGETTNTASSESYSEPRGFRVLTLLQTSLAETTRVYLSLVTLLAAGEGTAVLAAMRSLATPVRPTAAESSARAEM